MTRIFAGIVFGFAGDLVKVFALQVFDLVADDIDLFTNKIAGSLSGIDDLSSLLARIFCKF